ncbi:unnamed protein product [Peronospora destructor]|uniref:TPX2 C-terminal domain-containing protein n=1 Tax=Peronospora destructor TaxID=86335 RepID=A0AAV0SYM0_9STRA|nr:unnamed protein product [Peronospora destructor]
MTEVQLQSDLLDTQGSRKEKEVTPKKIKTVKKKKKKVKTDSESTATEKKENPKSNEEVGTELMLATKSGKNKRKDKNGKSQKKTKQRKSEQHSLKEVVPAPLLIVLSSNEEDDKAKDKALPMLRRSARSKRRASRSLDESTDRSGDASLWIDKKKLRRVGSASELTCNVDALDVTLTQTTQTTYPASDGSQGPTISDTPSGNTPTKVSENKQKSPTPISAELGSSTSAVSRRKRLVKDAVPHSLVKGRNSASRSQKSTQNTAAPNALRSAIAQAVSQRQQLLSRSQAERCQRSTSESDYGLSDIDLPEPSASCNGLRSSDSIRHEERPSIGLLPPLIERSLTTDGRTNLERKRVFLRAKELAFEQLKAQRENEFQQQELELLRYETEAREALARQELRIKQMRIRATIIQPMISAGASVADIVERLRLL